MPVKNYKSSSKMNMNPDDHTLMLWLEDELTGADQARIDDWATNQPEWLAKRDASRQWRGQLRQVIPASEEPPYADFFQSKLLRTIEQQSVRDAAPAQAPATAASEPWWRKLWLPLSAAAAMALCFFGGTLVADKPSDHKGLVIYTPEEGVKAEFFETSPADGTVIVLNGVAAIPDTFEVPDRAAIDRFHGEQEQNRQKEAASLIAP